MSSRNLREKQVAKTDLPAPERVLELSPNMAIYKVHLDSLRERDVNARVMEDQKFRRLTENIKKQGDLESLPLVSPVPDRDEFYIISGHHRTRAARAAGVKIIHVICIEKDLSYDEITAKQLSHNALAGFDNPDVLRELYESIKDIDAKLESGLTDLEIKVDAPQIPADQMEVEFNYEPVYILFLQKQARAFEGMLDRLEQDTTIMAADKEDFAGYVKMVNTVSKREGIRNIAAIFSKVIEIVNDHYDEKEKRG